MMDARTGLHVVRNGEGRVETGDESATSDDVAPTVAELARGARRRKPKPKLVTLTEDDDAVPLVLTVVELAGLLRLTTKGVYAMVAARRIPFVKVSNRVRFLRSDVLRFLSENRVLPEAKSR